MLSVGTIFFAQLSIGGSVYGKWSKAERGLGNKATYSALNVNQNPSCVWSQPRSDFRFHTAMNLAVCTYHRQHRLHHSKEKLKWLKILMQWYQDGLAYLFYTYVTSRVFKVQHVLFCLWKSVHTRTRPARLTGYSHGVWAAWKSCTW